MIFTPLLLDKYLLLIRVTMLTPFQQKCQNLQIRAVFPKVEPAIVHPNIGGPWTFQEKNSICF